MNRIAVFTGAGASKAIGYPLTRELLPRICRELATGVLFENTNGKDADAADRAELEEYLRRLLPGLSETPESGWPLITDVFSMLEYAIATGEALPVGDETELRYCRDLLKQAITDVLLGDFIHDWDADDPEDVRQQQTLRRFTAWLRRRREAVGVITTNYDIGLDFELHKQPEWGARNVDRGFDWRDPDGSRVQVRPARPQRALFKLHGSLDQLRCPTCGHVYFNEAGVIAFQAFLKEDTDDNTCCCANSPRLQLHIVAPSFVRDIRDSNLLAVWRSALEWMRTSSEWYIVGYSMPPEDLAIRSLLMRAYHGAGGEKNVKITVVGLGNVEEPRYRAVFPRCDYVDGGLEGFLSRVT